MERHSNFIPDESQHTVIELGTGCHLVLAPPGCGKTQILTERVVKAHSLGIDYADMLMLTFTNRAARVMQERIGEATSDGNVSDLYVGNIHRYCSTFLFANNILPADASVIDEEDATSILANHFSEDENAVRLDFHRRRQYSQILHLSNLMQQILLNHPSEVRLHSECLTSLDVKGLRWMCDRNRREFNRQSLIDIYNHTEQIITFMAKRPANSDFELYVSPLLYKMVAAKTYSDYKAEHNLYDFNDLLILTYHSLHNDTEHTYHRYRWVQVDEVQDLSPLQLAIIDELMSHDFHSITYLGDEQQAIFSFMGAKLSTLNGIKERCQGRVFHLSHNHRSPDYLLKVFNDYAEAVLSVGRDLLPDATHLDTEQGGELSIISSAWPEELPQLVAKQASTWLQEDAHSTTAIIVQSNREADMLSDCFSRNAIAHFKVSGQDVFDSPQIKLILAHLDVVLHETSLISWARLLTGLGVCRSASKARQFVTQGLKVGVTPSDLFLYDKSSYIEEFVKAAKGEIVVFDTETTGLNVAQDDILQIAAVKLRNGRKVEQSDFCIYIDSSLPIPTMLGDIENPIIEERKHHHLYSHEEALSLFVDYIKGCTLIGHNSSFDYNILRCNLDRYLPNVDLTSICPKLFDTLRLTRLLCPRLKQYKLKSLIETLGLKGKNSHLADADVEATCSLMNYCMERGKDIIPAAHDFIESTDAQEYGKKLKEIYAKHYLRVKHSMLQRGQDGRAAMTQEMNAFYQDMISQEFLKSMERIKSVLKFIECSVIKLDEEPTLITQLQNHLREMSSYKESDLCSSECIDERIFITTIHKAKGLEFDNVVIYDLRDDRLPGTRYNSEAEIDEKRRLVYVAMTRAKRRLAFAYPQNIISNEHPLRQQLSRFVMPILHYFK